MEKVVQCESIHELLLLRLVAIKYSDPSILLEKWRSQLNASSLRGMGSAIAQALLVGCRCAACGFATSRALRGVGSGGRGVAPPRDFEMRVLHAS